MAAVPGSIFRRILFWAHLSCGVAAGVFILVMSFSGVLLTYERQMLDAAARDNRVAVQAGATTQSADELARIAQSNAPPDAHLTLVFDADPAVPVTVPRGREGSLLLDPYTGALIPDAAAGERRVFRTITQWHRYLGGESRSTRAALMDYGNLLFLFIVVSGIYIWLPKVWRWRNLRGLMLFQSKYINAKVRDFNWHHVFSFWMLIPLALISLSGVVMSFDWANRLVYTAYGEEPPQRRAPQANAGQGAQGEGRRARGEDGAPRASVEALRAAAAAAAPGWQRLTVPLAARGPEVEIVAELKSSERRAPRQTVTLSASDATVLRVSQPQGSATQSKGQKARSWFRLVHTGEQYGVVGQTIAGVASLAACFLVYTGLALAFRRLIRPLFRREA